MASLQLSLLILSAWLLLASPLPAAVASVEQLPKPSANAGRSGTYQVDSGIAGCSYYVCVPAAPVADAHWGLHLFFHGQNGQNGAGNFAGWQAQLLDAYGLIGINMCYADGDNLKNPAGKVAAAKAAVLQVMADYPVVPGRGMVACFSGGGVPCGLWYGECAKNRGLAWPFTAQALYSANFRVPVQPLPMTGWYVGVNTDEWSLAALGQTQTARFAEALSAVPRSGPDQRFLVVPHLGHTVPEQGVAAAAALFRRIDLAYAPFLHQPSLPAKVLAPIIANANAGEIGAAATALARLKADPAIADQVDNLRAHLDARAAAQIGLLADLAATDPLLANCYGGIFARSLKGHPREVELKPILANLAKQRAAAVAAAAAMDAFIKGYPRVFTDGPRISAAEVPMLEQVAKAAGEKSVLGTMATELLALPHAPPK